MLAVLRDWICIGTTLIWQSASTVDSVKKHVLLMQLLKDLTLSLLLRLTRLGTLLWHDFHLMIIYLYQDILISSHCCRNFCMIRRNYLRMVTDGKLKLQRTYDPKVSTDDYLNTSSEVPVLLVDSSWNVISGGSIGLWVTSLIKVLLKVYRNSL